MPDQRELFHDPEEGFRSAWAGVRSHMYTALPCIVAEDSDGHTVKLQVAIKRTVKDRTYDDTSYEDFSMLVDVPVQHPGGGGITTTFPIKKGDEILAIFSSRAIDAWHQSGGVQQQIFNRMHSLSDGMALPGWRSTPRKIPNISTEAAQLRTDDLNHVVTLHPQDGLTLKSTVRVVHDAPEHILKGAFTIQPTDDGHGGTLEVKKVNGVGGIITAGRVGDGAARERRAVSRNWLRECHLIVGDNSGKGLDLGNLRVRFETISHTNQELASAQIVVTNPSRNTAAKVQSEFTKVVLKCGYQGGNVGPIFSGTIVETQWGEKENNYTDELLRIWARDGDAGYNQAQTLQLWPRARPLRTSSTPRSRPCSPSASRWAKSIGIDLSQPKFPRGYVLTGMVRDFLREVATSKGATWNLNGGKLNMIAKGADVGGGTVVLNANTGMIGQPIERPQGIIVNCLINPAIAVDSRVQIDQRSIVQPKIQNEERRHSGT